MNPAAPGNSRNGAISIAMAALVSMLLIAPVAQADSASPRVSVVKQIPQGGRSGEVSTKDRHEHGALLTVGKRAAHRNAPPTASAKPGANDFWFYYADVELFGDDDRDGYFFGIDLLFDADTIYDVVDVYAVAFLSLEGGPWNEYAVTSDFTIAGATSDDEYVVVTELETGYPTGSYDLLIELYDAVDGAFLASFGPEDSSELAYLPLEDFQRDAPFVDELVVVGHGGGNGFGLLPLLLLPMVRLMRRGQGA